MRVMSRLVRPGSFAGRISGRIRIGTEALNEAEVPSWSVIEEAKDIFDGPRSEFCGIALGRMAFLSEESAEVVAPEAILMFFES